MQKQGKIFIDFWCSNFKNRRQVEFFIQSSKLMSESGWRLYLVLSKKPDDESILRMCDEAGLQIIYFARPKGHFDISCIINVYKLCRQLHCDVIKCKNMHTSPLIGAFLAGVPVRLWNKVSMNSAFEECRKIALRDKIAITTRISNFLSTSILANSSAVKNELVELGIPKKKIIIYYNPKNEKKIGSLDSVKLRANWGYKQEDVIALTVGHAVPVKAWDVLLKAFFLIAEKAPHLKLLLVGSISASHEIKMFKDLEKTMSISQYSNNIKFAGFQENLDEVSLIADLFVLPSHSEGCANVLIEAMVAGLPCITTRVGAAEELVKDSINGFIVERNNAEKLSEPLLDLANDNEKRARFTAMVSLPKIIPTREEYFRKTARLFDSLLNNNHHTK